MMLEGLRVLDLSRLLPGGYATLVLHRMGADVIKVEPPRRGDPIRAFPGGEVYYEALHAGKRSVALPLKSEGGRQALLALVARSDVLLEGFRPGVMERLQLGYDSLTATNPRLVYCALSGYGSNNAMENRAGHDLNYLARSGVLALMPRTQEIPMIPGVQIADMAGGMQAVMLILAALVERQRSGRGRRVEVSMTAVMQDWLRPQRAAFRAGIAPLALDGRLPCYHVYRSADGLLSLGALEPPFWQAFCQSIDRLDLTPRQVDPTAIPEVAAILETKTTQQWLAHFEAKDVCVEPVLSPLEATPSDELDERAPTVGQHTAEVLAEVGFNPTEDVR
jgi:crotonobetainyl-CoA:carnitine CoA-transferase CaiB-like acyl-CoA transferase